MDMDSYQCQALTTSIYPREHSVVYPVVGLANEAGEALGKIKKVLRRDRDIDDIRESLIDELGDCLWYIAVAADDLGIDLSTLAGRNTDKLKSRKERGVLRGDGDNR